MVSLQEPEEILFAVNDLTVTLEKKVIVSDMSFDVHRGEIVAIIGPNGAGKTTLVRAILGLLPWGGKVFIREGIKLGFVPQAPETNRTFPLKVKELFNLFSKASFFVTPSWFYKETETYLKKVNGRELLDENVANLSMGEFQKILIAVSLAQKPDVLFLDEPASNLDIIARQMFFNEIQNLAHKEHKAVVFISHDIGAVYNFADKVICLNKDQKCFGVPKSVLTHQALLETYGQEYAFYSHQHPGDFPATHKNHEHHHE